MHQIFCDDEFACYLIILKLHDVIVSILKL